MIVAITDGFDGYTTIADKWSGISGGSTAILTSGSRTGPNHLKSFQCRRQFPAGSEHATVVLGFAFWFDNATSVGRIAFMADSLATTHITVLLNPVDGTIQIRRGTNTGTILYTSAAGVLSYGNTYYVEIKAVLGDSTAGSVEVRLNGSGTASASISGVDTKNAGTQTVIAGIDLGSTGSSYAHYDDVYVNTGADAAFWGDTEIVSLFPNAAGDVTQLTPTGSANNWENVDEAVPNDADYNQGTADGLYDLYNMQNLSYTSGNVKDVVVWNRAVKNGLEAKYARTVLKSGGTEYEGASGLISTTASYNSTRYTNHPAGGAWTRTQVNDAQVGGRVKDT